MGALLTKAQIHSSFLMLKKKKKKGESLQRNKEKDHLFSSTHWKDVSLSQLFTEIQG